MAFLGDEVQPEAVRLIFGLDSEELSDSVILQRAVRVDTTTKSKIPTFQQIIDDQLTDPDTYAQFQDYVAYTAALYLIPTLTLQIEKSFRTDSGTEGDRFDLELDDLRADIESYLSDLLDTLAPDTETSSGITLMTSSPPDFDVVTGQ